METSLSLIICTFKRPNEVGRLLDSVSRQRLCPDETLVIDASPDDLTEQAVRKFKQQRSLSVDYYRVTSEHAGLTRQRNFGIARARGDIIAFLDDDTVLEPDYFAELLDCFERHPNAVGVGGYIVNELRWRRVEWSGASRLSTFRFGDWECRDDYRWRLRRLLGLESTLPPGWMPPFGHGRTIGCLPPDAEDYHVEFVMGGASAWRRDVLDRHQFSHYFEGYGLYEDMDFCVRAAQDGPLYVCTRARLAHYHAPPGRPNQFHYGEMVVRNGWFVWRRRWPHPALIDRLRWWAITLLLIACRFGDVVRGPRRRQSLSEAIGRLFGIATLLISRPTDIHTRGVIS